MPARWSSGRKRNERITDGKKDDTTVDENKASAVQQTAVGEAKELTDVSAIVQEVMPSIVAITNKSVQEVIS